MFVINAIKDVKMKKYKRGLTLGSYDLFHVGHSNLFKKCKEQCEYLVVGISTDKFNTVKGKECDQTEWERERTVRLSGLADFTYLEKSFKHKLDIIKALDIDVVFMGSDWKGAEEFENLPCDFITFPRTKGISSTKLRKKKK